MSNSKSADPKHSQNAAPRHGCCGGSAMPKKVADAKHSGHDCCEERNVGHAEAHACEAGETDPFGKPMHDRASGC